MLALGSASFVAPPEQQCRRRRIRQRGPPIVHCRGSLGGNEKSADVSYGLNFLQWAGQVVPQGTVVSGVKAGWRTAWQAMVTELAPQTRDGSYARPKSSIRSTLPKDARFEPGQLVLYVGNACPWCHRTTLTLALRGIAPSVVVVQLRDDAEKASRGGWVFTAASPDPVFGKRDLREVYDAVVPGYTGRCTAPLLVDSRRRAAVSNDSEEICRILNGAFPETSQVELRPPALVAAIEALNEKIYTEINNGVYQSGFATSQIAYDRAQVRLAAGLADMEARLGKSRFLHGDRVTESDVHLFPTIARHDAVYASLFKCSATRVRDLPNLQGWLQDLYLLQGVAATMDVDGFRESYFGQLFPLNPSGIVPTGPTAAQLGLGRDPGRAGVVGGGEKGALEGSRGVFFLR